jgi:hypothetical protein
MVKKSAPLTLVQPGHESALSPPAGLADAGRKLWCSIMGEYAIADSGGLMLLEQAARALDRAEDCSARVAVDGPLLLTKQGPKDHPLLRHETANRALAVRILARLGLDVEPLKGIGRPAGSRGPGISWKQLDAD